MKPKSSPLNSNDKGAGLESILKHIEKIDPTINFKEFVPQEILSTQPSFVTVGFRSGQNNTIEPLVAVELSSEIDGCTVKNKISESFIKGGFSSSDKESFTKDGITFYLACQKNSLSFGLNKESTKNVLNELAPGQANIPALLTSISKDLLSFKDKEQLGIGRIGHAAIVEGFKSAQQDSTDPISVENNPIESLDIIQKAIPYNASYQHEIAITVALAPKNDAQTKFITDISRAGSVLPRVIDNSILQFGVNKAVTSTLIESGFSTLDKEQKSLITSPDLVQQIAGLSLGFIAAPTEGTFPSVFLELRHDKAQQLKEVVEQELKGSLSEMVPANQWKQKELQGHAVSYMNTPFGIGAFLATSGSATNDSLILTTSEDAISKVLNAKDAPPSTKSILSSGSINFSQFGKAIEDLQSSFSFLTKGEQYLSNEDIVYLKGLGHAQGEVSISPQAIEITYRIIPN
jgi:hypothetical protein